MVDHILLGETHDAVSVYDGNRHDDTSIFGDLGLDDSISDTEFDASVLEGNPTSSVIRLLIRQRIWRTSAVFTTTHAAVDQTMELYTKSAEECIGDDMGCTLASRPSAHACRGHLAASLASDDVIDGCTENHRHGSTFQESTDATTNLAIDEAALVLALIGERITAQAQGPGLSKSRYSLVHESLPDGDGGCGTDWPERELSFDSWVHELCPSSFEFLFEVLRNITSSSIAVVGNNDPSEICGDCFVPNDIGLIPKGAESSEDSEGMPILQSIAQQDAYADLRFNIYRPSSRYYSHHKTSGPTKDPQEGQEGGGKDIASE
ncbi:hypothetical protein Daus18300_011748 [Diaporthe australafricana]|uniref:Uncharacterized protein n=1 Tax=Diaporthe australafricana TaxID=127596 RepID=A0ABR3W5F1_9PEZI